MNNDFIRSTSKKLSSWAENLPEEVDFFHYWGSLLRSEVMSKLDYSESHSYHATYWTRWQEEFEKEYTPMKGDSFSQDEQAWTASFIYFLSRSLHVTSRDLAEFYGDLLVQNALNKWFPYHTMSYTNAIKKFVREFGLPLGASIEEFGW